MKQKYYFNRGPKATLSKIGNRNFKSSMFGFKSNLCKYIKANMSSIS